MHVPQNLNLSSPSLKIGSWWAHVCVAATHQAWRANSAQSSRRESTSRFPFRGTPEIARLGPVSAFPQGSSIVGAALLRRQLRPYVPVVFLTVYRYFDYRYGTQFFRKGVSDVPIQFWQISQIFLNLSENICWIDWLPAIIWDFPQFRHKIP